METNMGAVEKPKKGKAKDIFFTILIFLLAAAHILVMLQSAGIIRADR